MAHFFYPSHTDAAHATMAADQAALSEITLDPGQGYVKLGLWGGAADGSKLSIKVHRNGQVVSDGNGAAVKIQPVSYDKGTHVQVVTIYGLRGGDFVRAWDSKGAPWTSPLPTLQNLSTGSAAIERWAKAVQVGEAFVLGRGLCPTATPYLALQSKKYGAMPKLKASCVGGPLVNVHGLAVHCTAGNDASDAFTAAAWRCVPTWNTNGASAHFVIAGNGALVQLVPTTHVAYAQGSPANAHWISVEVDNNGRSEMNGLQMDTLRALFRWVITAHGIPPSVATGCLFPKSKVFDEATSSVCDNTTTDGYAAIMSEGLSCHWWLEPTKGKNSHACPGKGIIGQLADVVA